MSYDSKAAGLVVAAAGAALVYAVHKNCCSAPRAPHAAGVMTVTAREPTLGLRCVCISDTHGRHRDIADMPTGDVLIHAGDYTHFGKKKDAVDLNDWFGELLAARKYSSIIVVDGNHEANAEWRGEAEALLSNATVLRDSAAAVSISKRDPATGATTTRGVRIFGTKFMWPLAGDCAFNPYSAIPPDADVVVVHGPPKGRNDGGKGCSLLAHTLAALAPRLVVSGHIHFANGCTTDSAGTVYVNAAMCRNHYAIGWAPMVVDI